MDLSVSTRLRRRTSRVLSVALAALAPLATGSAQEAAAPAGGVTHVALDGELDVGALSLIRRAAAGARERGDVLVVELDTPGGNVEIMWRIAGALDEADSAGLATVAWVRHHALSAGALVAVSCDSLFMHANATIGSAQPILSILGGLGGFAPVEEKFESALRGDFRARFASRGPFGAIGEAMVDADSHVREVRIGDQRLFLSETEFADRNERGEIDQVVRTLSEPGTLLNLTAGEALAIGLIDGLKESLDDVVATVHRRGTQPTHVVRARSEDFASWVDRWWMALVFAGLVLAWTELKSPGFGVPGVGSVVCFAVFLTGRYLAGLADWVQILLVALGVGLLAFELFLAPGTIWAGLAGAACLLVGLVWSNLGPGAGLGSQVGRELLFDSLFYTLLTALGALAGMYAISLLLPRTPLLGRMVQAPTGSGTAAGLPEAGGAHGRSARPGALGRALTDLRPVGKVALDADPGLEFEARSSGLALDRGTRVRVIEVEAGRLVVEADASIAT